MNNGSRLMTDELLVSYLLKETDEATSALVERWIVDTAENARYFENFRTLWIESERLRPHVTVDVDAAWQRFTLMTKSKQAPVKQMKQPLRRTYRAIAAIAAGIILILGGYMVWQNTALSDTVVVAQAATKTASLPDGSEITLNRNSQVVYTTRYNKKSRDLQLKGEAFFDVKPDRLRPFRVHVNDVLVTVVGTSFNIKDRGDSTEVIVETGVVEVTANAAKILLQAGERALFSANSIIGKDTTMGKLHNYYRTKEFVCDNTPLWRLVEVLNEAYESNIVIGNSSIRNLPLTTTFHNEPLDNILRVLSQTFDLSISREGDKIILR